MVIFGASGDLTTRKLIPALYNLRRAKLLPDEFALLGVAVDDFTETAFRDKVRSDVREYAGAPEECKDCDWLAERVYYGHAYAGCVHDEAGGRDCGQTVGYPRGFLDYFGIACADGQALEVTDGPAGCALGRVRDGADVRGCDLGDFEDD